MGDLLILLLIWLIANFIPHITIFIVTGKIYYQLTPIKIIIAETSIMLLNLILPLIVLSLSLPYSGQISQILYDLGWQWKGLFTIQAGLTGLTELIIIMIFTQRLIGKPLSSPKQQLNFLETFLVILLFLLLTPIAEETMFRGYIQSVLSREYGPWIGIMGQALTFGLRHLPMDVYNGITQRAPLSAWISRILQLYIGGFIFGIIRYWADSIWASWVMHECLMLFISFLSFRIK